MRRNEWDSGKPICLLPDSIAARFQEEAQFLQSELETHVCESMLILQEENHQGYNRRRVMLSINTSWYSELYRSHSHFRRDRSLKALHQIGEKTDNEYFEVDNNPVRFRYSYQTVYRQFIYDRLIYGFITEEGFVAPDINVCRFFLGNRIFRDPHYRRLFSYGYTEKEISQARKGKRVKISSLDDVPF